MLFLAHEHPITHPPPHTHTHLTSPPPPPARQIFIDEIDSLGGKRGDDEQGAAGRRILTEILQQMDGVGKGDMTGVLVLGATNKPYSLDEALRRRFQKRVYIPLPDEKARTFMFKLYLGAALDKDGTTLLHTLKEEDYVSLARMTDWFSGSDISTACTAITNYPLKVCTSARLWRPDGKGKFFPMPSETVGVSGEGSGAAAAAGAAVGAGGGAATASPLATEDLMVSACSHPQHPRLPEDPTAPLFPPFTPPPLPLPSGQRFSHPLCPQCSCVYIRDMYDWETHQVGVPPFSLSDCKRVLVNTRGSVGKDQLKEYEQ